MASYSNNCTKFADETTVIDVDYTVYRKKVANLVDWCHENNLFLNADKTRQMITDPRRRGGSQAPCYIGGAKVERVEPLCFLCVNNSDDITWTQNAQHIIRKSQQTLFPKKTKEVRHARQNSQ